MPDPPEHDGHQPDAAPDSAFTLPIARTLAVLLLFVVTTALLVGKVHPASVSVAGTGPGSGPASAGGSPPTTTHAAASSTTSPATHAAHGTTTTTTPPAKVPVLVANASGAPGVAGDLSNQLHAAGWDVLPPVNASTGVPTSSVYYAAGEQHAAGAIAATLHVASAAVLPMSSAVPVASVGTAQIVVIVGPDLATRTVSTSPTSAAG